MVYEFNWLERLVAAITLRLDRWLDARVERGFRRMEGN